MSTETVMDAESVRGTIRSTIGEYAKLQRSIDLLSDDDDLYTFGLTSLTSVNVMLAIEDAFDVEFPDSMLRREVFASVAAMTQAVQALLPSPS